MNIASLLSLALVAAVVGLVLAAVLWARERGKSLRLAGELELAREKLRMEAEAREAMGAFLSAQAKEQANAVATELAQRAEESFRNRELLADQRLAAQLKPVADTLAKFEAQVVAVEKVRAEETGGLKAQISALMEASTATQTEARKLSAALRRGAGVQGRWGEQTLRNVLELAGLQSRFDFDEQASTDSEEGRRRPDVVVKMPGGGVLAIDAKCSLNAFIDAQEQTDDMAREAAYVRHAESVRTHMRGLSAKGYQNVIGQTPDVVAMFVPGDGFLAAALERQPNLLEEAMKAKIVIVTPTTLFALCKAVHYGWRVEERAKNADQIAVLGRELYKRIAVMGGHAAGVGKALEAAVSRYNQFVGSLESQVLVQARRFEDLAVDHEGKEIAQIEPVEAGVRPLAKLGDSEAAPN